MSAREGNNLPEMDRDELVVTRVEKILREITKEVLELEEVGLHDNFFALGGSSLTGIRLLARLRYMTGAQLRLRTVYEAATIGDLALQVARAEGIRDDIVA